MKTSKKETLWLKKTLEKASKPFQVSSQIDAKGHLKLMWNLPEASPSSSKNNTLQR